MPRKYSDNFKMEKLQSEAGHLVHNMEGGGGRAGRAGSKTKSLLGNKCLKLKKKSSTLILMVFHCIIYAPLKIACMASWPGNYIIEDNFRTKV